MNEAIAAAQADHIFQLFLARLFGKFMRHTSETAEVQAYAWRDHLYIVKCTEFPQAPKPNLDSQM